MKMMLTGSNGLLGQKIIDLFLSCHDSDDQLIATARGNNRHPNQQGYQYLDLDITNADQVLEVVNAHRPDVLIHTAAMTNVDQCEQEPDACQRINVDATRYLAEACLKNQVHLVHVSTDFIFDGKSGPYSEDAIPNPISIYGQSKLDAEKAVMASGCSYAILRTVLVYGVSHEMSRSNIVLWVRNELRAGKTIRVVNDQIRSPTLAEDLAQGCWLAASKKAQGVFNISGAEQISILDLVKKVADMYELDKNLIQPVSSLTLAQPAKRPPVTGFIIEKAQRELGYRPTPLDEGIKIVDQQLVSRGQI
jgi:dTDP-4-dehydrorhamnose reductase